MLPPVRVRVIGESVRVDGLTDNLVEGPEALKESIENALTFRSDAVVLDEAGNERRHPAAHVVVTFNITLTRFMAGHEEGSLPFLSVCRRHIALKLNAFLQMLKFARSRSCVSTWCPLFAPSLVVDA